MARTAMFLALAAAAGVIFVAQSGAGSSAAGWKRVTIARSGVSLEIPASWKTRSQRGYDLVAFDPAGDPVIGTAVSLTVFGAEGYGFDDLAAFVRSNCKANVHRLDPGAAIHTLYESFPAGRAQVCYGSLKIASGGMSLTAVNRTYGFLHDGRGYVVGFQTLLRLSAAKLPVIQHVVGSLRFPGG
jgi:hypothetical protein